MKMNILYNQVYEAQLWKLNADGDPQVPEDWLQRRFWLAKNGSFCYHSAKEGRDLIYYRPEDVRYLKYRKMYGSESCKQYAFELTPAPLDELEYSPGLFAADQEQVMLIVLGCIERYQRIKQEKERRRMY